MVPDRLSKRSELEIQWSLKRSFAEKTVPQNPSRQKAFWTHRLAIRQYKKIIDTREIAARKIDHIKQIA